MTEQAIQFRSVRFADLDTRDLADDGAGTFEGYANLHGVVDSYGTKFKAGAWDAGGLDQNGYALLWMHDPWSVIGVFQAKEDVKGLWIAGAYDNTDEGQRARVRAKSGSAGELSVGFVPLMVNPEDEDEFTQARLVETSQITARMAAQDGAALAAVRQAARIDVVPPSVSADHVAATELMRQRRRAAAALRLRVARLR